MKAMNKICGNSRGPPAVKRLSHDVFVLFIRILITLNRKRWQEFLCFFNLFFQATADPPVSGHGSSSVMSSRVKLRLQVALKITPVSVLKHFQKIQ